MELVVHFLLALLAALSPLTVLAQQNTSATARSLVLEQALDNIQQQVNTLVENDFVGFCIKDAEADEENTFPFGEEWAADPDIAKCDSEGRLQGRLCNQQELLLYFKNFGFAGSPIPDNENCNNNIRLNGVSVYPLGCAAGYAAPLDLPPGDQRRNRPPEMNDVVPKRVVVDPNSPPGRGDQYYEEFKCCVGFFCPANLACMIPCPRGAYCPLAYQQQGFRQTCSPYGYLSNQRPCGGADIWGIAGRVGDAMFCPPGSFCAAPTQSEICPEGTYCRKGSEFPEDCRSGDCPPGTKKEDLTATGISMILALSLVLLIVFKCTDKIGDLRAEIKERSRERAARKAAARDTAIERWHAAKSFVVEQVRAEKQREELEGRAKGAPSVTAAESDLYAPIITPGASSTPTKRGGLLRKKESSYKFVYDRLAKQERRQRQDGVQALAEAVLTGSLSVLGESSVKAPIELEFVNLGLTLKSNGRRLLENVTGKLSPGRVCAVMGPSGAGKTTFLTALAGKETYSDLSGRIFINGEESRIQSYKRIIGFVPQDDIVHGNLTVEENLWFSANYRLPANFSQKEKLLVVERTINALGLQSIRTSMVGTVEQRGISGGQRKRVNVGLEMVMEPSLLILDEPTSGLDSTSSRLVIQALRREATRGVNVGVVLHQPSYGLFRMFDEVMFLAKGGRVVYLGPVNEVEGYFDRLGFPVPERVNPSDHYMDVLEGWVKPASDPHFNKDLLPQLWIQNRRYRIDASGHIVMPPRGGEVEMGVINLGGHAGSFKGSDSGLGNGSGRRRRVLNLDRVTDKIRLFFARAGEEIASWVRNTKSDFLELFQRVEDRSGRTTPGFFWQYWRCLYRFSKQRFRETRMQLQDYIILLITGALLGYLSPTNDDQLGGANAYSYTSLAMSLLAMIAALRTFSGDRLNYWRESASGIHKLSYFLAKDTLDHVHTFAKPVVYLSTFYFFNNPRSTFQDNYGVLVALVYCCTGVAYMLAILLPPAASQLTAAVVCLVESLLASKGNSKGIVYVIYNLSFIRWALEGFILVNAKRYSGVWLLTRCTFLQKANYNLHHFELCIFMLILYGLLARMGAFFFLVLCNRDKQK